MVNGTCSYLKSQISITNFFENGKWYMVNGKCTYLNLKSQLQISFENGKL